MPVKQRPAAGRGGAPAAASKPPFHFRIPDVFAELTSAATQARSAAVTPQRDAIAATRAQLSEKRFLDGHQQLTSMIAGLRDRRRRLFSRLWAASILLTALSIMALVVEVVQRMTLTNSAGDTVQIDDRKATENSRGTHVTAPAEKSGSKPATPREWSNQLPQESAVQSAVYETARPRNGDGAWLRGTISDNDSDSPRPGDRNDDHQSRAD